jgi:hypothetical protein
MQTARAVEPIYRLVRDEVLKASRAAFRADGIDESVLEELSEIWWRKVKESQVMDDDGLGNADRNGVARPPAVLASGATGPKLLMAGRVGPAPALEPITADGKRQVEDIIMMCADLALTPDLIQLLQKHSAEYGTRSQPPRSIQILQNNQWDGSRFLGEMGGTELRKLADQLVVYLHRSTKVLQPTAPMPALTSAPAAAAHANQPSAATPAQLPQLDGAGNAGHGQPSAATRAQLPQLDGAGDAGHDDEPGAKRVRYADYSDDEDGGSHGSAAASGGADETELNSDDDDTVSEDDHEMSVILCQFKKVTRSKLKYMCDLQNGVMLLHPGTPGTEEGREYVFASAKATLEWEKQ